MKYTYFNNAAGAHPIAPGVIEAVTKAMLEPPRVSGREASTASDGLHQCRSHLSRILCVDTQQTVLTSGATYGLNVALLGLELGHGDLVISTVMEHNSVLRPLARLEDRHSVRVEYVSLDADARLNRSTYDKLLDEAPRLVVLSHASNVTGRVNPVKSWFVAA